MACQLQLQLGCCSWVAVGAAGVWVLAVGSGLGCAEWFRVWLGRAGQDLSALAALLCLVICWDSWYRASRFRRIRNQAEWRIVCLHNCWILPWPAAQCFCFWAVLKVTCHAVGASLWGLFGAVHGVDKKQLHFACGVLWGIFAPQLGVWPAAAAEWGACTRHAAVNICVTWLESQMFAFVLVYTC